MKESKRVQKALKSLETIVDHLQYFMGSNPEFRRLVRDDISPMEELIRELAIDQKEQNTRLAKKLKGLWKIEKNQKIEQLYQKVEDLEKKL